MPPQPGSNSNAGCAGPVGETVAMIDPMGVESSKQFPCFEHPTLLDLLDSKGIIWRYYAPSVGSGCTAPNAIKHLRFGSDWQKVIGRNLSKVDKYFHSLWPSQMAIEHQKLNNHICCMMLTTLSFDH